MLLTRLARKNLPSALCMVAKLRRSQAATFGAMATLDAQQLHHISQAMQQATVRMLQKVWGTLMGQVNESNLGVAETVTQRRGGGQTGPRRCLENNGMVPPRLEPKTSLEERAYSFRYYGRMANKEASEIMRLCKDEKAWRSGVMAGIGEHFPWAVMEDISAELFRLLVNSSEREDLQAVKAVEDSQGPRPGGGCFAGGSPDTWREPCAWSTSSPVLRRSPTLPNWRWRTGSARTTRGHSRRKSASSLTWS